MITIYLWKYCQSSKQTLEETEETVSGYKNYKASSFHICTYVNTCCNIVFFFILLILLLSFEKPHSDKIIGNLRTQCWLEKIIVIIRLCSTAALVQRVEER